MWSVGRVLGTDIQFYINRAVANSIIIALFPGQPPACTFDVGEIMIVFDAHLDLAWNAIDWNRDLRLPVAKIRQLEKQAGMTDKGRGCNTVSFPELRRGKVAIFIATFLAPLLRITATPPAPPDSPIAPVPSPPPLP